MVQDARMVSVGCLIFQFQILNNCGKNDIVKTKQFLKENTVTEAEVDIESPTEKKKKSFHAELYQLST